MVVSVQFTNVIKSRKSTIIHNTSYFRNFHLFGVMHVLFVCLAFFSFLKNVVLFVIY